MNQTINFQNKLELFSEHWSPKVIAEMNDYQFKLVKTKGEFTWHNHADTDETFIVLEGSMGNELKDWIVQLNEGGRCAWLPTGKHTSPSLMKIVESYLLNQREWSTQAMLEMS